MNSTSSNRLTAGLSVGSIVLIAALIGLLSGNPQKDFQERTSTFFTDSTGARGILLVLQRLLPAAEPWRRPLLLLPKPDVARDSGAGFQPPGLPIPDLRALEKPEDPQTLSTAHAGRRATQRTGHPRNEAPSTLIVAGPQHSLSPREAISLQTWIAAGGQLVLLTRDGWLIDESRKTKPGTGNAKDARPASSASSQTPTFLARFGVKVLNEKPKPKARNRPEERTVRKVRIEREGGKELSLSVAAAARWEGTFKTLATVGVEPLAVEVQHGKGRIVALSDPGFLSNAALREGDNAVWLVQLCAGWGNGKVMVDEYHHGFGQSRGPGELTLAFMRTPWGWCALQLLAAGGLYVFLYHRRMGCVSEPPIRPLSSPLDLVNARAGLFRTAKARHLAAELICQDVCRQLGSRLGEQRDLAGQLEVARSLHRNGRVADLLAEIQRLYLRLIHPGFTGDSDLAQLGLAAGRIQEAMIHEQRTQSN